MSGNIRRRLERLEREAVSQSDTPLDAQRVAIKTRSVQVKVVTVDDKQMTLAVFRQLPNRTILARWLRSRFEMYDDGEVAGPTTTSDVIGRADRSDVWGIVNYFWKDCGYRYYGGNAGHLHVIWAQEQGEGEIALFRSCVGKIRTANDSGTHMDLFGDRDGCRDVTVGADWQRVLNQYENHIRVRKDPAIEAMIDEWNNHVDLLERLDQLFIAI